MQKFANNARAELVAGISDSDTALTLVSGGSLFPVANTGAAAIGPGADWFKLVLQDVTGMEIVYCRTHVADSTGFSNLMRAQEGTTARTFSAGAVVGLRPTAGDAEDVQTQIAAKETLTSSGALIDSATAKATPVDADYLGLMDSAASNVLKKLSWANVKATLKTYFDTLYQAVTDKDATGGYVGLTLFKINFKNAANTFTSFFTNTNTAARTYTFQDRDGTIADLGANTFTGAQILSDQQVSRAMLIDCGLVAVAKGNSGTSLVTFDYTAGSKQKSTATGNHTFAFSNWPPTGNEGVMHVEFTNYGAFTITPPTVTWHKPDGTTTTTLSAYFTALAAAGGPSGFAAAGTTEGIFWCDDAATVHGRLF